MLASASMHKNLAALLMAFAVLPVAAIADEPAKPPPPKWYDTIEIHGLVDAYYSANVAGQQTAPNFLRTFDSFNGFQLAYGYSFLDDTFRISGRGEYLDDSDGATGITNPAGATLRNKYWEGTLF